MFSPQSLGGDVLIAHKSCLRNQAAVTERWF